MTKEDTYPDNVKELLERLNLSPEELKKHEAFIKKSYTNEQVNLNLAKEGKGYGEDLATPYRDASKLIISTAKACKASLSIYESAIKVNKIQEEINQLQEKSVKNLENVANTLYEGTEKWILANVHQAPEKSKYN